MNTKIKIVLASIVLGALLAFTLLEEPWKKEQLIHPKDLAAILGAPFTEKPVIFNIGPAGNIAGALEIGATQEQENLRALEQQVQFLPKDKSIIIYCGCCPFKNCPNIRPAFSMLSEQGFTRHKLLDLPSNLKVDWIDKGYPMKK